MVALIVMSVVFVGFLVLLFRLVLRASENDDPAIGNNSPYPTTLSSETPPYMPNPMISEREEFLNDADRRLAAIEQTRRHRDPASWMDVPGAMEAAGLVDEDLPAAKPSPQE